MLPGTPDRRPRRRGRFGATVATAALVLTGVAGVGGPATGADEPGAPTDGRPTITAQEVWEGEAGRGVVSIPITVTGTPAPTVTASDLPPGVTLIGHQLARFWQLTGSVTTPGEYTVTLTADNGVGEPAVTTVVFQAEAPPTFAAPTFTVPSPDGPVTLVVGVPATVELVATGSPVPTVTIEGTLPAGLTIVGDGAGGLTITGTPTQHGTFRLTARATNAHGTDSLYVLLTIGRRPVFGADALALSAETGRSFTTRLDLAAFPPATLAVTDGALPPGVLLTPDGQLQGAPTAPGRYEATLTATNEHGVDSMTVVIDVWTRPGLADPSGGLSFSTAAETAVSATFRTVGWPAPSVTLSPGWTLPPGLSLRVDPDDPYAWQLVGEVARADAGQYWSRFVVANGVGPDRTVDVSMEVTAPPRWDPPAGGTVVVPRGEPMPPLTIRVTGYPLSSISYGWSGGDRINVLSTESGAGERRMTLVGTLPVDYDFQTCVNGDTRDCAGGVQTTTHFVVRDRPVVVAPDAATVHVGTAAAIPPITVTTTHDASLTAEGLPAGLSLVPDPGAEHTWLITGRPETTAVGRHTVVLTADNGVTGTASIRLDVTGPPTSAAPTSALLLIGETPTTVVRAAGLPAPAMTVTGELPDGVTATDDGTGALHLGGAPTRTGTWTVQVHAANDHGSASTEVTLTVEQAAAFADEMVSRTLREGHEITWAPTTVGVPAPVVSLVSGDLPEGVTLDEEGMLVGAPAVGTADAGSGRYTVVLRAANSHGEDLLPVTFTVLSPPPPTATPPASPSPTPSPSPSPTASPTPTPTATPSPTASPTPTAGPSPTPTPPPTGAPDRADDATSPPGRPTGGTGSDAGAGSDVGTGADIGPDPADRRLVVLVVVLVAACALGGAVRLTVRRRGS